METRLWVNLFWGLMLALPANGDDFFRWDTWGLLSDRGERLRCASSYEAENFYFRRVDVTLSLGSRIIVDEWGEWVDQQARERRALPTPLQPGSMSVLSSRNVDYEGIDGDVVTYLFPSAGIEMYPFRNARRNLEMLVWVGGSPENLLCIERERTQ